MMVGGGNHEVAIEALTFIYLEGVADLVDPDDLVDAIGGILIEMHRASAGLAEAARRGELSRQVWHCAVPQAEVHVTDILTGLAYIGPGMNKPVLDRFAASHPSASPTEIAEAIMAPRRSASEHWNSLNTRTTEHVFSKSSSVTTRACTQRSGLG